VFIRDERALEEYLLNSAIPLSSLKFADGETILGNDMREFILKAEKLKNSIERINNKINNALLLETLLLSGLRFRHDPSCLAETLRTLANNDGAEWSMDTNETHYIFKKTFRNVSEIFEVSKSILETREAQSVIGEIDTFGAFLQGSAELKMKETSLMVRSPIDFFDKFMQGTKKGVTINRYKGLGEMDAAQLWETTIDPNARVLMQVKLTHLEEVDEIFSTLMGEVVEPRREFIQENALNVVNLDA
jgi:DNA gyrase subunit B